MGDALPWLVLDDYDWGIENDTETGMEKVTSLNDESLKRAHHGNWHSTRRHITDAPSPL
jgi:hypothetical protein